MLLRLKTMPEKLPKLVEIELGKIKRWGKNPRKIAPDMLQKLAHSIQKYGVFQTLTVWEEDGEVVAGGGNMRLLAMTEALKWPARTKLKCFMNYPSSEAEKIELSFLDNQAFGFYNEFEVAGLVDGSAGVIDADLVRIQFDAPVSLSEFMANLAAGEAPPAENPSEGKTTCPRCGREF